MQLEVQAVAGMNGNAPVAVELVLFYDLALLEQVQGLSAAQWFAEAGIRFRRRNATGRRSYAVRRWEWVPGQQASPEPIRLSGQTEGAILFADYATLSHHRAVIENPEGAFRLNLRSTGFEVEIDPPAL